MITYPNQRIITVFRDMPNRKENKDNKPFVMIYRSSIDQASKNLKGQVAFKLWLYLAGNTDSYTQGFSPQAIKDYMGVSLNSARQAFNQLVQKKYLIQEQGSKNRYKFYERPHNSNLKAVEARKRFLDDDEKEVHLTYKELLEAVNDDKEQADRMWSEADDVR